ncbi:hypothetical protein [Streptomyces bungoensis]|uniref:hypothetical protein n=1 Tax=Streptomyces bungoensis TaxID=285568 RepID=UPI003425C1FC
MAVLPQRRSRDEVAAPPAAQLAAGGAAHASSAAARPAGHGRSTPVNAATAEGRSDAELAAYLGYFGADSIVADAEHIRRELTGGAPWTTLGQSFGGFVTAACLSAAPEGLAGCLVTGGLPGLTAGAAEMYDRLYPRVAVRNAAYYRRYPEDVARVREIADHLGAKEVRLPDGDRLTIARLRFLGKAFGGGDGFEQVHGLIEDAWHGDELGDPFRYAVMAATGLIGHPLFALQESIYGRPGAATGWAAEQALA